MEEDATTAEVRQVADGEKINPLVRFWRSVLFDVVLIATMAGVIAYEVLTLRER